MFIIAVAGTQDGDRNIHVTSILALLIVPIIWILVIKTPNEHACMIALLLLQPIHLEQVGIGLWLLWDMKVSKLIFFQSSCTCPTK